MGFIEINVHWSDVYFFFWILELEVEYNGVEYK